MTAGSAAAQGKAGRDHDHPVRVLADGARALADREAITALAQRAETLGYDSVFVTDRMLIPVADHAAYPYSATGAFPLGPDEPWLECPHRGDVPGDASPGGSASARASW